MLVSDRTEAPILPLIELWILPGSIIYSECWKSYHNINKFDCCESPALLTYKHIHFDWLITNKIYNFLFTFVYVFGETMINYTHITVNHDQCYKDPVTGTHTNTVEEVLSRLKTACDFLMLLLIRFLYQACGILLRLLSSSQTGLSVICLSTSMVKRMWWNKKDEFDLSWRLQQQCTSQVTIHLTQMASLQKKGMTY